MVRYRSHRKQTYLWTCALSALIFYLLWVDFVLHRVRVGSVSLPLTLGCPYNLPWPKEWARSDDVPVVGVGLTKLCSPLLFCHGHDRGMPSLDDGLRPRMGDSGTEQPQGEYPNRQRPQLSHIQLSPTSVCWDPYLWTVKIIVALSHWIWGILGLHSSS